MMVVRVCSSTKSPSMSHSLSNSCRFVKIMRGFLTNRNRVRYSFGVKSSDSPDNNAVCSEKSIFRMPSSYRSCRGVPPLHVGKDGGELSAQHGDGKGLCDIVRAACFIASQHIAFLVIGGQEHDVAVLAPGRISSHKSRPLPSGRLMSSSTKSNSFFLQMCHG